MADPTAANVRVLVPSDRADADYNSWIATALVIVNEELANKGLSANRRFQIALYLSAHFAALATERGEIVRDKMGDADQSYRNVGSEEDGFTMTRFGQMALVLDPTGTLAGIDANKGLKAKFEVVSSEDPYVVSGGAW
jgi:hypothetical protein